jgi:hypothetical protein
MSYSRGQVNRHGPRVKRLRSTGQEAPDGVRVKRLRNTANGPTGQRANLHRNWSISGRPIIPGGPHVLCHRIKPVGPGGCRGSGCAAVATLIPGARPPPRRVPGFRALPWCQRPGRFCAVRSARTGRTTHRADRCQGSWPICAVRSARTGRTTHRTDTQPVHRRHPGPRCARFWRQPFVDHENPVRGACGAVGKLPAAQRNQGRQAKRAGAGTERQVVNICHFGI